MVELVDTSDLKSDGRKAVRVQFPLRVHNGRLSKDSLSFLFLTTSKMYERKERGRISEGM